MSCSIIVLFVDFTGAECDLILERDGIYFPIEIKATTKPSRGDTTGITAFRNCYPQLNIGNGIVICLTEKGYKLNERDFAIPWSVSSADVFVP